MNNSTTKLMFSSKSNEWATPQPFFNKLDQKFNFTLDPCATKTTAKCKKFYTSKEDGLSKSWQGETVFVNPPYGRGIDKWIEKGYNTSMDGKAKVVMLIPARTDTKYWHNYVMRASEVYFVKGRLKFGDSTNSAPFPSAIVVFASGSQQTFGTMNR